MGRSLSVPLSHVGLILTPGAEGVAACQGFDEATVWGHDMAPSDKENVVTKIREVRAFRGCEELQGHITSGSADL